MARGCSTRFLKCVVTNLPRFDNDHSDRVEEDYDEYRSKSHWSVSDEGTNSAAVMQPTGYQLMARDLDVEFTFTHTADADMSCKYPTFVGWEGPAATIKFVNWRYETVHSQPLARFKTFLKKNDIVGHDATKPYSRIVISIKEGFVRCQAKFVFSPKPAARATAAPKKRTLGADMEADEASKDVTIVCRDGETLKVQKSLLCMYSKSYAQRFETQTWTNTVKQETDSLAAWQLVVACMYDHPIPAKCQNMEEVS